MQPFRNSGAEQGQGCTLHVQLHLDIMDPTSPIKLVCLHLSLLLLPLLPVFDHVIVFKDSKMLETANTLEDWKRKLIYIEP